MSDQCQAICWGECRSRGEQTTQWYRPLCQCHSVATHSVYRGGKMRRVCWVHAMVATHPPETSTGHRRVQQYVEADR